MDSFRSSSLHGGLDSTHITTDTEQRTSDGGGGGTVEQEIAGWRVREKRGMKRRRCTHVCAVLVTSEVHVLHTE